MRRREEGKELPSIGRSPGGLRRPRTSGGRAPESRLQTVPPATGEVAMRTYFDCVPCFIRQTIDAVRRVTDDESLRESVLRQVLQAAGGMDLRRAPPVMGQVIHRVVRKAVDNGDPYREEKRRLNYLALSYFPGLRRRVLGSRDPFGAALRAAGAGNVIDLGVKTGIEEPEIASAIESSMASPLDGEAVGRLQRAAARAKTILCIGDNAGEIVFDRLLVEQLGARKVVFGVRGGPVINDATMEDARVSGMAGMVEVIDSGSDAPGTILEDCSDEFRERFREADLVLAKGQGNFETLCDSDRTIVFLLRVKCAVVAEEAGARVGSLALVEHN